ncbi:MAG TPA: DMT family transporter [Terriglobia bacterium]|jgi:drug/metabolite transporter (DMT)-like permease
MRPASKALLQIHFCVFLWGFTAILGKAITLSALPLVWWRMLIVTAALVIVPGFWRGLAKLSGHSVAVYLGIGLVVAMHWLTFYGSIKLSNASVAATCMAFTSVFIAFFEPFMIRRPFDVREIFFGLAIIPGVALLVGGTPAHMRTGLAVGVLSAFLAAMFGILNKLFIHRGAALTITGLEMAAGAICFAIIAPILPAASVFVVPTRHDAVLLLTLALACTLAPFALSLVALRHISAFTTALALNMEPVYAIVLAILIFREEQQLTPGFYLGVVVVLAVVFAHSVVSSRGERSPVGITPNLQ